MTFSYLSVRPTRGEFDNRLALAYSRVAALPPVPVRGLLVRSLAGDPPLATTRTARALWLPWLLKIRTQRPASRSRRVV